MRRFKIPSLALSLLLQVLPVARVVTAEAALTISPVMAVLRMFGAALAVAGSYHSVSGATVSLLNPANGAVRATNGLASAFRVEIQYSSGGTIISPAAYDATGLPPGFNQPTKSGSIWRITGTPTQAGVFKNVAVTGYERADKLGDHRATFKIAITVVDGAPAITEQPAGLSTAAGQPVTLSVTATGGSLSYQWLKDDLEITSATNSILSFAAVQTSDAGTYRVRIQNSGGNVLSDPAIVTVTEPVDPPSFTTPPQDANLHEGESLALSVAVTGSGVLTFQWLKDTQPIQDGTAAQLIIPAVVPGDAGSYAVRVTGSGGSSTSPPATVTVAPPLSLEPPLLESGGLVLSFNGIIGRAYVLETLTNGVAPGWQALQQTTSNVVSKFSIPSLDQDSRLLRVRTQ